MSLPLEAFVHGQGINGRQVAIMDKLKKTNPELFNTPSGQMDYKVFEKDFRPKYPIQIRHDKNSISFTGGKLSVILEAVRQMAIELDIESDSDKYENAISDLEPVIEAFKEMGE